MLLHRLPMVMVGRASQRAYWLISTVGHISLQSSPCISLKAFARYIFCPALKARSVLAKETDEVVIRLASSFVIEEDGLDWALHQIAEVLTDG